MRQAIWAIALFILTVCAVGQDTCAPPTTQMTHTAVYMGTGRPKGGVVSRSEWNRFVATTISPRFTAGFTVLEAAGQWRGDDGKIVHERTKMLVLLHDDKPETLDAIQTIMQTYRVQFGQDAVLKETWKVCAVFLRK